MLAAARNPGETADGHDDPRSLSAGSWGGELSTQEVQLVISH
jgi:hypothetical protein